MKALFYKLYFLKKFLGNFVCNFLEEKWIMYCWHKHIKNRPIFSRFQYFSSYSGLTLSSHVLERFSNFFQIKEQLLKHNFSEEWISRILICITLRKNDIKQSLTSQSSCIAQASLKNYDWNVKVICSESIV